MRTKTRYIKRNCAYCKKRFNAQKITTLYCSHICNCRAYKANIRLARLKQSEQAIKAKTITTSPELSTIQQKQFLDIKETCILLKCSESTLRKLISKGSIPTLLVGRKHIIRRTDIELLFDKAN